MFLQHHGAAAAQAASGPAPVFAPSDLADLGLWLDADDVGTIAESAGLVSQWSDKSGNGFHVGQGTNSARPITGARTVNGRNAIDFDGNDHLHRAGVAALMDGACTVFTVWQADITENIGGIIEHRDTALIENTVRTVSYADTRTTPRRHSGRQKTDVGGSAVLLDHPTALSTGVPYQMTMVVEASHVATGYEGGVQVDTTTLEAGAWQAQPDTIDVGRQFAGPLYHDGPICEIVIYTRALTTIERQQVEGYLMDKWGIV